MCGAPLLPLGREEGVVFRDLYDVDWDPMIQIRCKVDVGNNVIYVALIVLSNWLFHIVT